jgi:uncharacterized membrane protein YgcG
MPSLLRAMAGLVLAAVLALALAPVAMAQDAPRLQGRLTDAAGVFDASSRTDAEDAINRLSSDANIDLYALFVSTTDGTTITDFADEVAASNSLGGNDALLVVAMDDRTDGIWIGPLLVDEVSVNEQDSILADRVEPQLRAGDYAAAVSGAAQGLADAIATTAPGGQEPPPAQEPPGQPQPAGGASWIWIALGLVVLGLGVWLVWGWFRGWRGEHLEAEERDRRTGQLAREANALLIQTDEELRHDQQELGFAEAQFGAEEAKPFREAIEQARSELQAAFKVRQQLDDEVPEDPPTREKMLNEIIARCRKAQELVGVQTEHFRQLRDLERRAPEVLADLRTSVASLQERRTAAANEVEKIRRTSAGSLGSIAGNVEEAGKRLTLADQLIAAGEKTAATDRTATVRAVRGAQDATAQADQLLDAVEQLSGAVDEAAANLEREIAAAEPDVIAARRALDDSHDRAQAANVAEAEAKLASARQAAAGDSPNLVLAYRMAREANSAADAALAAIREGAEKRQKAVASAQAGIQAAEISVQQASDFISSRRASIGRTPRTRLAEAQRRLDEARGQLDEDPASATNLARQAARLADDAYRLAADEFDRSGLGGDVVINGRPYGRRGSGWGDDFSGALIGSIIGSILSGGGRRGGPFGGGGGFGGGGFGGFGGGGFGGGGGGGRSIGGGFGGGGGRSRGGGW